MHVCILCIVVSNITHCICSASDEQLAHKLQLNEEDTYYDITSSSAAEEQKKQFEQLHQLQLDAELALKLQEQLDAVSGSCDLHNFNVTFVGG